MKREIYIAAEVHYLSNGATYCTVTQSINNGELMTSQLDESRAKKLIWELVLAGGHRSVIINPNNPRSYSSRAYLFASN